MVALVPDGIVLFAITVPVKGGSSLLRISAPLQVLSGRLTTARVPLPLR